MADKGKLYSELYSAFKSAYPNKSAQYLQSETNTFWRSVKTRDDVVDSVQKKLYELGNVKRKNAANLLTFWSKVCNIVNIIIIFFIVLQLCTNRVSI